MASVLNQSCVVWDSGLTCENKKDLEQTQKTFVKLVLEEHYETYQKALKLLHLETLEARRKTLFLSFIKQSLADGKLRDLFSLIKKHHPPPLRILCKIFHESKGGGGGGVRGALTRTEPEGVKKGILDSRIPTF